MSETKTIDMAGRDALGWRSVIGSAIAIWFTGSNVFGWFGVFNSTIIGATSPVAANTMTGLLICLGIGMFVAAVWHAKLGTRKMFILGAACTVVAQICAILAVRTGNAFFSLAWGFMTGANSCFIYSPGLTTAQNWFPNKRGLVTGIVNLIFGGAASVTSLWYRSMAASMGFETCQIIICVVSVVVTLIGAFMTEMPQRSNMTPEQRAAHEKLLEDVANARKAGGAGPSLGKAMTQGEAVKTKAFWALWLMWLFMGAAGISMTSLSTQYADSIGLVEQRVVLLTCFNVTNGVSRIIAGAMSDKIGRIPTAVFGICVAAIGYFFLPMTHSLVASSVCCACVGYGFGTMFAITAPIATDLFGLKEFGKIFGLIFTAYGFVGGVVGPILANAVLTATDGNFGIVFRYLAVFCAIGAIAVTQARLKKEEA